MPESHLEELERMRASVEEGGGEKRIRKQHEKGKYTARERIEQLLDPGSFVELDMFARHRCSDLGMGEVDAPGEGVVTGYGTVDGRRIFLFAQDFTVVGGSLGEMHARKICKVMDLAVETGAPMVGINDSGGARIQEGVDALSGYGQVFYRNTLASGVIPQISAVMGPCAGGAVYSPALTDFVFMTKGAYMFITGPQVIKAVTGEDVSPEALGGAMAHNTESGVAHFVADEETACLAEIRRLLGFIPGNNLEDPPVIETGDSPERLVPELRDTVPVSAGKSYDVRDVITAVVDNEDFMEVHALYAPNIVVGFARINGGTV
ncbi:MAG: acyl-CoA carboxylase subunit beta, partial [Spirochaetota bacterium]